MVLLVLAAALGLVAQGAQAAGMGPTIAAASSARTAMSDRCGECSDKSDHGGTFASICTVACAVTPALTTAVAAPLDVQPGDLPACRRTEYRRP